MKTLREMTTAELDAYLKSVSNHKSGGARGLSDGGRTSYRNCLEAARSSGSVGVHLHMRQPQEPTCRLGMVGKVANKSKVQPKVVQPTVPVNSLQAKYEAAQKAKMANDLKVRQYGNCLTSKNCKNALG